MNTTKFHLGQGKITHKVYVDQLRSVKFPDYSNHTFVNDAYRDFVTTFLSLIEIRTMPNNYDKLLNL